MTAARLAWTLCVAAVLCVVAGPGLMVATREHSAIFATSFAMAELSMAIVGAVVAARLPRQPIGWLLLSMGLGLGLSTIASAYAAMGIIGSEGPLPFDYVAAWLGEWTFVPVIYGGVVLLLYLFPDGHFISVRWRWAAYVTAALVACATTVDALAPGPLEDISVIDNPFGATGSLASIVTAVQNVVDPLALPAFLCAVAALVVRFRRARGIERQQLKWIVASLVLVGLGLGLTAGTYGALGEWTFFLAMFGLAAMPVAIGMAMLRYRLYDIDVVMNRALVYTVLTATLGGVYLGSVLLLQLVLSRFTEGSSLAIAVSTLAVAAVFRPARARIQDAVDRQFFRRRYDAGRTLDRFATQMRDQVALADIGTDLLAVVGETVQPSHASLWLREGESTR